ncbi:MAG: response regulator [Oscillospiraceae bacterium]|nr:response regulator [Oscillospiraceae bacterium]
MDKKASKKKHDDDNRPVILAVDDAPDILRTVHSLLKDKYKVHTLSDPVKLKELLTELTPDLFLLDYSMPEISGFELMPIIRSFPEHKNTPVIYLTSIKSADFYNLSTRLGACDYLIKPINAEKLREKIELHTKK